MQLRSGVRIGPYEVGAQIGAGGMGEVYRATDTNLNRQVALKVLPASVSIDPDRLARFRREAEVLAALNHPHIAQIFGLEPSDGTVALVMELVEGPTLADRIARGALALDEALPIARQIAEALAAAHDQGIIHRDLKPANIKVRADGTVKVLDFGLAKVTEPAASASPGLTTSPTLTSPAMTQAGIVLGTAAYMAPEQARGKPLDKRVDIWAFGAVVYEMLSGERAYAGGDIAEVLASVLAREPDWTRLPAGVSPATVTFLKRCLEKDPKRRVRDIGDVALALDGAFDAGAQREAAPPGVASPLWKRALPLGLVALAAALATAAIAWSRWPAPAPPPVTRFDYVLPEGQQLLTTQRSVVAVSPDGRSFVYHERSGLFLRSLEDLEARLITGTQGARLTGFFSPDGRWIAYVTAGPSPLSSFTTGQLKKVPVSGGAPITLCELTSLPGGASWSDDNTILFAQSGGIARVSSNGGPPDVIIRAADGEQMYGPQLLPGGDVVLFSVTKDVGVARWDQAQVVAQSLSTGRRSIVVPRGSDARYLKSGHVIYSLGADVLAVAFDPRRLVVHGAAVPVVQDVQPLTGVNAAGMNLAVSNDGTLVYLASHVPLLSMTWVSRNGGSEPITTIPAGSYSDVRLSPDGSRVVVTQQGDIWTYDLATGRSSRVTRDGTSQMAAWDPKGLQIAFSSARGGNLEAWVAPADGSGGARQLTTLGGQVHVDNWSPDGRILTLHQHPGSQPTRIFMLPMDRTDAKPLPFDPPSSESASFSRDGGHVSYLSSENGRREIFIRAYPGPGGQMTVSVGGGMEALWSRRGDEVFYRSLNGDRMFAVPVSAGATVRVGTPVQLFQGHYFIAATGSPRPQYDVSADGQRFLMLAARSGADTAAERGRIVVVQNWFEELKRLVPATN